ncbi:MAG: NAD(P)-dependent oxidoreductase [Candidatus Tenebribacter mawsonii]|nr:NAD(P)-dependent oxidoreductase [Candidatus Tenebribacter mawsonii]
MIKILFIWKVDNKLKHYLQERLASVNNINLIFPDNTDEENLLSLCSDAQIIIGWRPTHDLLKKAEKLSVFINPGAGVQHLVSLFKEINQTRQVHLINGHDNSYFTAQHGVALLLSLTNKLIPHHQWMKEGKWRMGDKEAKSIPLRSRKIGLLGYGHVNRQINKMLQGFTDEIQFLKNDYTEIAELHDFLEKIDILICAVPFTSKTKNMLKMKELKLLGKDGILINLSRGQIINEKDLFEALQKKLIQSAAIDVWYNYNPIQDGNNRKYPFNYPFQNLDNIVLSPHRSASPFDDLQRWDEVIENITRFANDDNDPINIVDLDKEY